MPNANIRPGSKNTTICFVANYEKTYFFHEIALRLQKNGISIRWITVNNKLKTFLENNYGKEKVLYISRKDAKHDRQPLGSFKLNELVYGDRVLKYSKGWAHDYLKNIQQPIYEFINKNKIKIVFGEVTWAHEILIHRITKACPELSVKYLCPHTIRIPNGRFGFFIDEYQSELVPVPQNTDQILNDIEVSGIAIEKPDYLALNDVRLQQTRTIRARIARVKRYFTKENVDPSDPTLIHNRLLLFGLRALEELNKELYHLVPKVEFNEEIARRDFVFLALHKQPEASIDVIGRYYEDQYVNILNIWRSLPDGWLLLVKEHTNAIGDRSWFFYRKLRRLRNVLLVNEKTNSHDIIRRSRAVVTVSGTVAYEATLLGLPSLTFGDVFFNRVVGCQKIDLEQLRTGGLSQLIKPVDTQSAVQFSKWLALHSAEGVISDPGSNPFSVSDENANRISYYFTAILNAEMGSKSSF